jgi:hypothetical protein
MTPPTPTTGFTTPPDLGTSAGSSASGSFTQGSVLPNVTTTQEAATAAPSFYTDFLNQLATQGASTAQNSQYVGASPLQQQAFSQAQQNVGNYQPALNLASQNLQQAGSYNPYQAGIGTVNQALQNNATGAASPYLQDSANISGLNSANPYLQAAANPTYNQVQDYMNPYIQSVVNAAGTLGEQNIALNLAPQATAGLVGSGQFGSTRGATALGDVISNADLGISAQQAGLLSSGYQNAAQQAMAQNQLNAQLGSTAGQLTNQQAQNMLQAGSTLGQLTNQQMQNQLSAGQTQGSLASQTQTNLLNQGAQAQQLAGQQQALGLGDINALSTLGGQQQTIAQNQQLFPMQQLTNESALLRGYTVPTSVSTSTTAPGQQGQFAMSPLQQLMGLGSLATGLFSADKSGNTPASNLATSLGNIIGSSGTNGAGGTGILGALSKFGGSNTQTPTINDTTGLTLSPDQNPSSSAGLLLGSDGQYYVDPSYGTGLSSSGGSLDNTDPTVTP